METAEIHPPTTSRAVLRQIDPGNTQLCDAGCGDQIHFKAYNKNDRRIIANVYENGVWKRVEHFHPDCYDNLGQPYGPPIPKIRQVQKGIRLGNR